MYAHTNTKGNTECSKSLHFYLFILKINIINTYNLHNIASSAINIRWKIEAEPLNKKHPKSIQKLIWKLSSIMSHLFRMKINIFWWNANHFIQMNQNFVNTAYKKRSSIFDATLGCSAPAASHLCTRCFMATRHTRSHYFFPVPIPWSHPFNVLERPVSASFRKPERFIKS